jgi:pimeloyl-ACP methyl ester carboxylesterase
MLLKCKSSIKLGVWVSEAKKDNNKLLAKMASSITTRSVPFKANSASTATKSKILSNVYPSRLHSFQPCRASLRKDQELLTALWQAASKETLPWLNDLALPAFNLPDPEFTTIEAEADKTLPPTSLADPDSKFISVAENLRLHYKERRPSANYSSKPTILLIHGFNGSTFSWRANIDAIASATGCRVLAVDRPPFGLTDRPLEWGNSSTNTNNSKSNTIDFNPYELEGSVKLMEMFLDALNITGPVIPVGHSAGALVALEMARRRPHQITSLSLIAPAVPTNSEHSLLRRATFGSQLRFLAIRAILGSDEAGLRYIRRQLLKQKEKVSKGDLGFKPHPSTASFMISSSTSLSSGTESLDILNSTGNEEESLAAFWETAAELAIQEAAEGYTRPLRAHDWDRAALLNLRAFMLPSVYDYSCVDNLPVLVVQGDDDGALTQNAAALVEILKESRKQKKSVSVRGGHSGNPAPVTVFEKMPCGHVPMEEMPYEFNQTLIEFLNAHAL